jgi:2-amino-4-hydroxy-6-hydroxymethyldihydropteridine diphosphokinase
LTAAMARVVILTGSNRGEKAALLARAAGQIEERVGPVVRRSGVYESAPWGFSDPESFLNQVLIVETGLKPIPLLDELQSIEEVLGRVRKSGRGVLKEGLCPPTDLDTESQGVCDSKRTYVSRPIDIDILFYDDLRLCSDRLTLPHPLIAEREFVLTPLREVMGDFIHPVYGKPIREL